MKTLLAGLLVVGAILVGSSASAVGASVGSQPAGIVSHSGSPTVHEHGRSHAVFDIRHAVRSLAPRTRRESTASCRTSPTTAAARTTSTPPTRSTPTAPAASPTTRRSAGRTSTRTRSHRTAARPRGHVPDPSAAPDGDRDSALTAKGWTASDTRLFTILLPAGVDTCFDGNPNDGCASNAFCAYHSRSGSLIFAVEPFNASFSCSGANELSNPQGFPNGPEIDETVNTTSHEMNEAITDPDVATGWYSSQGNENGDLCAWWFGAPLGTVEQPAVQPGDQRPRLLAAAGVQQRRQRRRWRLRPASRRDGDDRVALPPGAGCRPARLA